MRKRSKVELQGLSKDQLQAEAQACGIRDPKGHKGHKKTWIDALMNLDGDVASSAV
jgi:hypothetical protein